MKSIVTLALLSCVGLTFAQNKAQHPLKVTPKNSINKKLYPQEKIEDFVSRQIHIKDQETLTLLSKIESKTQIHYTYQKLYKGIPIHKGIIKVSVTPSGDVTLFHNNTLNGDEAIYINEKRAINTPEEAYQLRDVWIIHNNTYLLGKKFYTNKNGLIYETATIGNEITFTELITPQFQDQDTTGQGFVFLPNPITSANTTYGGNYVDNGDQTNAQLDAERVSKPLTVTFQNNQFELVNSFVEVADFDPPLIPVATSANGQFMFNRSESGFEDVNALFHITQEQTFIQSLGFTNLVNYPIKVDAHGFSGADQSAFYAHTNPPSIIFGTGGVDDAEDADVIIHEYGHAVMHSASPNSSGGSERNAIDEAVGDYLAGSYSRSIDPFDYFKIFNWDGHNEFWDGRTLFNDKIYPQDLQNNLYLDAPMFSGSVMNLELTTNKNVAHTILFEAAYSIYSFITMPEMANLMIQADSLLYGGQYYGHVCYAFYDRGILDTCSVDRPVGIKKITATNFASIYNTLGFANGTSSMKITTPMQSEALIYSLDGKLITKNKIENEIVIKPELLTSGTYLLIIIMNNQQEQHIIQRY